MDIFDVNIKILNDKYEIFLNKILYKSKNIITYLGKNIYENKKIIIDVYNTNIQLIAKKIMNNVININHQNIIKINDIIIEKNITYIFKPYYISRINNLEINNFEKNKKNKAQFINYFKQLINVFDYLYNNNIEIELLTCDNIYIDNNNLIISPYFENNLYPKNIIYGSPIFNTIKINIRIDLENKIIKNIKTLFNDFVKIFFDIHIDDIDDIDDIDNNIDDIDNNIDDINIIDIFNIYTYLNNSKTNSLNNIINYLERCTF